VLATAFNQRCHTLILARETRNSDMQLQYTIRTAYCNWMLNDANRQQTTHTYQIPLPTHKGTYGSTSRAARTCSNGKVKSRHTRVHSCTCVCGTVLVLSFQVDSPSCSSREERKPSYPQYYGTRCILYVAERKSVPPQIANVGRRPISPARGGGSVVVLYTT
jgi:hypothetical protein